MLKQKQLEQLEEKLKNRKQQLLLETTSSKEIIDQLMSENVSDELDYAEIFSDSYNMATLCNKQIQELNEIDISLKKLAKKTYGVCEMCDEEIGLQRLKAKPHARFCVECRPVYEKIMEK